MGACTGPVFATNTIPSAPGKERGERGFLREVGVRPWRVAGLDPLLFLSCRSEDAGGAGSNAILGRGTWRFGKGWRLLSMKRPRVCRVLAG